MYSVLVLRKGASRHGSKHFVNNYSSLAWNEWMTASIINSITFHLEICTTPESVAHPPVQCAAHLRDRVKMMPSPIPGTKYEARNALQLNSVQVIGETESKRCPLRFQVPNTASGSAGIGRELWSFQVLDKNVGLTGSYRYYCSMLSVGSTLVKVQQHFIISKRQNCIYHQ